MSAPAFTPAPWRYDGRLILASDDRCTIIAEVSGSKENPQVLCDARLLAAAPRLYAALKDQLVRHDDYARLLGFDKCACQECTPLRPLLALVEGTAEEQA